MRQQGPLHGTTVLDVTTALAGPFATLLLAGLGARVIKIEGPHFTDSSRTNAPYLGASGLKLVRETEDDISVSHLGRGRNKLAITLDLKHPAAREVFADLVRHADVVVENFSRGVVERLGVAYANVRAIDPRVVYCSISGFGADDDGPSRAMDAIIQALSGIMLTSGEADDPPIRMGLPFADTLAPLFAVIGILAALEQRHRTGEGQYVDVSMLDALTAMVANEPFTALEQLGVPVRTGRTVPRLAPFGVFRCSDGHIALCAPSDAFAAGVFAAIGAPELAQDERFRTRDERVRNARELERLIEAWTAQRTRADVLAKLDAAGVPAAEVRDPADAVRDGRVVRRGATARLAHPTFGEVTEVYGMGMPIRFSDATVGLDRPAPGVGDHNAYVYGELLGYPRERIERLRTAGVI